MFNKNISFWAFAFAVVFISSSCKKNTSFLDETDSKTGAQIYVSKANAGLQNLTIFPYTDDVRTFKFNAQFGALGLPANQINVSFEVDSKAFDSLNVIRRNSGLALYEKFPTDAYTLDALSVNIPKGEVSSNYITLQYLSKKFDPLKDYLLPVSIKSASGYTINPTVKTVFIVAPKLIAVNASKTGWTATASSEELVGEGTANGAVNFVIDGNIATFWHSKWQAPAPVFPHWINVDMKSEIFVTKIELVARQNNNAGFTVFNLEASKDGVTWNTLGTNLTFDPMVKTGQSYSITPAYWRYIKVTAIQAATASNTSTHLAEINIYRY